MFIKIEIVYISLAVWKLNVDLNICTHGIIDVKLSKIEESKETPDFNNNKMNARKKRNELNQKENIV